MTNVVFAHIELAESVEAARQCGLEAVLDAWPPSEGWTSHYVALNQQPFLEYLREVLGLENCWLLLVDDEEEQEANELLM